MKDIPIFTTAAGVASLAISEIPYRGEAFVHIRDVQPGCVEELLKECISFCRMAGAEKVYAAGYDALEGYPVHMSVIEMRADAVADPEKVENLFPVTESTVDQWRRICNERLAQVSGAATLRAADENRILASGGAYFVHHQGELLGTGWLDQGKLLLICAVKPGVGECVMHTLMSLMEGEPMTLEVASDNVRAIRLYDRLGFVRTRELQKWHKIF